MEAFAKSDDERDFYLDRLEGFLIYVDLDHPTEELDSLYAELWKQNLTVIASSQSSLSSKTKKIWKFRQ